MKVKMSLVWLGWDTGNLIPIIALAHTARQNRCWVACLS